jgi:hypothetical protein
VPRLWVQPSGAADCLWPVLLPGVRHGDAGGPTTRRRLGGRRNAQALGGDSGNHVRPDNRRILLLLGALLYDAQHLGLVGLWLVGATILLAPVTACVVLSLRGRRTALCLAVLLWGIVVNVGQVIVLFVVSAFVAAQFFRAFG